MKKNLVVILSAIALAVFAAIACGCSSSQGSPAAEEPDKIVGEYALYDLRNFQSNEMVKPSSTRYLLTVNQDGTFSAVNRADSSDVLVEGTWETTDDEKIYRAVVPSYKQYGAHPTLDSDDWTLVFQTALEKGSDGGLWSKELLAIHNGSIDVYRFIIPTN